MSTPCLCRGWPDALLLHTDKGGTKGGEAVVPLCTPVLPRPRLSAKVVQARAARTSDRGSSKGSKGGILHTPVLPRPTFRWGRPSSGRRVQNQATRHQLCTPELPRPHLSAGVVRATRRRAQRARADARRSEGVMRGGDGSCGRSWRLTIGAGHKSLAIYAPGYSPSRNIDIS